MKSKRSFRLYVLGVAALLLMLAPRPGLAQVDLIPDARTLCEPLEIHDGMPSEQACLKELAGVAKRDGRVLSLKLANGKTKTISDAKECEAADREAACVKYLIVGRIADRQFVLLVEPYECPYVLLVNRRTGEEAKLGGWPYPSPSRRRLVVTDTRDAGNCSPDYAVAVFSVTNDRPRLEWKYPPEGIEQYSVDTWNGDNRIQLWTLDADGKQIATDLKLTAQGWQLKRPGKEMSPGVPAVPVQANPRATATQPSNTAAPVTSPGR